MKPADRYPIGKWLKNQQFIQDSTGDFMLAASDPGYQHEVANVIRSHGNNCDGEWFEWRDSGWLYRVNRNRQDLYRSRVAADPHPYDSIAETYDAIYATPECMEEDRSLFEIIGNVSDLSVLDIGCGTGLFLDYATPRKYIGLDPSKEMLKQLIAKHPGRTDQVLACGFEEFTPDGDADLAVCLFGTANYIREDYVEAIQYSVKPGGRWVVMLFDETYYPVCQKETEVSIRFHTGDVRSLPGVRRHFGDHYIIIDGRRL